MKKLLLTGFEPFLDFPINPTMRIAQQLDGGEINEFKVISKILTVDFTKSGTQLLQEIEKVKPDAVISMGLAGGRYKITPERIAINCNDGDSDNQGYTPRGEKIFVDGQDGIFTTLPINKMIERLTEACLPAEISNSAGTYLCNNVMYHGLYYFSQRNQSDIPSGFIHIPASHELALKHKQIPSFSHEDLLRAIEICIECL